MNEVNETSWIDYECNKPESAGMYEWRVPHLHLDSVVVRFQAMMRTRGDGNCVVLSPEFDYWDGYRVHVPQKTQWRHCAQKGLLGNLLTIEGITLLKCPFCWEVPQWKGNVRALGGGVIFPSNPHEFNTWWLECCGWATTPRYDDPTSLCRTRNEKLRRFVLDRGGVP